MSKTANPGELNTLVSFIKIVRENDEESYSQEKKVNVFGKDALVPTKWVNAHGSEAFTCRYSPLITETCLVYRKGDDDPFEIISIDNVEQRNTWLEIKVQRRVPAR